jgi:phosphatidylserine decarboxylase
VAAVPNRLFFQLLTQLSSRKFISKTAGFLACSGISRRWIPAFAKAYNIPVEEAEFSMNQYKTLNAFFTRRLKPGARPVDADPNTIVSPVDAEVTACGVITAGLMLEIKGQTYAIDELLNGAKRQNKFHSGYFYVLYLSPRDYHRIHVPATGEIVETEEIAGKVYPVNHASMTNVKQVLSRNYRIATYIQHAKGELAVVKVAALNVASIQFVDGLQSQVNKGDELAYFEFGSTVVLLAEQNTYQPLASVGVGSRVKMGEVLGEWV